LHKFTTDDGNASYLPSIGDSLRLFRSLAQTLAPVEIANDFERRYIQLLDYIIIVIVALDEELCVESCIALIDC